MNDGESDGGIWNCQNVTWFDALWHTFAYCLLFTISQVRAHSLLTHNNGWIYRLKFMTRILFFCLPCGKPYATEPQIDENDSAQICWTQQIFERYWKQIVSLSPLVESTTQHFIRTKHRPLFVLIAQLSLCVTRWMWKMTENLSFMLTEAFRMPSKKKRNQRTESNVCDDDLNYSPVAVTLSVSHSLLAEEGWNTIHNLFDLAAETLEHKHTSSATWGEGRIDFFRFCIELLNSDKYHFFTKRHTEDVFQSPFVSFSMCLSAG